MRAQVSLCVMCYVVVMALCFLPCVCLCVFSVSSGLARRLSFRECHSKWVERPLTLTLPAQSQAISRACLPLTQTLPCIAEIKTWLLGSHLDKTPSNPNGIRVAYEATWSSHPLLTPNAPNSVQSRQSAQA